MKRKLALVLAIVLVIALLTSCKPLFDRNITLGEMTVKVPREFVLDELQSTEGFRIYEQDGYAKCIVLTEAETMFTAQEYITAMLDMEAQSEIGKLGDMECVYSTYEVDSRPCEEVLFILGEKTYSVALRSGDEGEFDELIGTIKVK